MNGSEIDWVLEKSKGIKGELMDDKTESGAVAVRP